MKLEDCAKEELIYYIKRQEKQSKQPLTRDVFFTISQKLDDDLLRLQEMSRKLTEEYVSLTTLSKYRETISLANQEKAQRIAEERRELMVEVTRTELRQKLFCKAVSEKSKEAIK